jgi:hypothetical protein
MNLLSKGMARKNMTTGIENNLRKEAEKPWKSVRS